MSKTNHNETMNVISKCAVMKESTQIKDMILFFKFIAPAIMIPIIGIISFWGEWAYTVLGYEDNGLGLTGLVCAGIAALVSYGLGYLCERDDKKENTRLHRLADIFRREQEIERARQLAEYEAQYPDHSS